MVRITASLLGICLVLASLVVLATQLPASGQSPSIDELLTRLFAPKHRTPYELTADFAGNLTFNVGGSRLTAAAAGSFKEWQDPGERKRRKTSIRRLHLPLVLRPFRNALRSLIEQRIETQSEEPGAYHTHDFFILNAQPDDRNVIAGIRRDIVDEVFNRYKSSADAQDVATRRSVARWLYTSASMRSWVARPGPPYAFEALVDGKGLIHELSAFYSWGQVGTRFAYAFVSEEPVWREVLSDIVGELHGLGFVSGRLVFIFANHCMNCP